jgi:transcriptional regulator with XRE-family HTH domain
MANAEEAAFYTAVGLRVRSHRSTLGLTQDDVAEAAGITRSSIANLEAGRQHVPSHTLARIAEVLHVEVTDLMPGSTVPDGGTLIKVARRLHSTLGEFLGQFDADGA